MPANALAVVLPWVELVTGVLLITGLWRREAAALAGGMLVMFLVAVSYVLWQGIDVANCGCFSVGGEGRSAGWTLIAGDLALLAAAAVRDAGPPAGSGGAGVGLRAGSRGAIAFSPSGRRPVEARSPARSRPRPARGSDRRRKPPGSGCRRRCGRS